MRFPRTDQELDALRPAVPDSLIEYLKEVDEEQRADVFSTVIILETPDDLRATITATDGTLTVDFGTPLYDVDGLPRVLSTPWEVASEPAQGWAFLYEMVSDEGGCAVVLNHTAEWVPGDLRADIEALLS